jgi:hypothetical protein
MSREKLRVRSTTHAPPSAGSPASGHTVGGKFKLNPPSLGACCGVVEELQLRAHSNDAMPSCSLCSQGRLIKGGFVGARAPVAALRLNASAVFFYIYPQSPPASRGSSRSNASRDERPRALIHVIRASRSHLNIFEDLCRYGEYGDYTFGLRYFAWQNSPNFRRSQAWRAASSTSCCVVTSLRKAAA